MAKVYVELPPLRNADKLAKLIKRLENLADGFDIPDAPLGLLLPSAALIAVKLSCVTDAEIIPHIRVIDHSLAGVVNIVEGLVAAGIRSVVLLRGDQPKVGKPLNADTEVYAEVVRSLIRGVKVGGLISIRRGLQAISSRIGRGVFDFLLALRATEASLDVGRKVVELAHTRGVSVYAYLLVRTGDSVPNGLRDQPLVGLDDVSRVAEDLVRVYDGVIVSSVGGGIEGLVEAAKRVSKVVNR